MRKISPNTVALAPIVNRHKIHGRRCLTAWFPVVHKGIKPLVDNPSIRNRRGKASEGHGPRSLLGALKPTVLSGLVNHADLEVGVAGGALVVGSQYYGAAATAASAFKVMLVVVARALEARRLMKTRADGLSMVEDQQ